MPVTQLEKYLAPYPSALAWYKSLSTSTKTEILCWNLIREFILNTCPEGDRVAFLEDLDRFLKNNPNRWKDEPSIIFREIRFTHNHCMVGRVIIGDMDPKETCCFEDQPIEGESSIPGLCRLHDVEDFFNINKLRGGGFNEEPLEFARKAQRGDVEPGGVLNSVDGYVWVTKLSDLENALAGIPNSDSRWEKALIILGLTKRYHKILIKYPNNFAPKRLTRPTFIEGDKAEFRLEDSADGWNRTVNLENGESSLPEAIHCPYQLTPDFRYPKVIEFMTQLFFAPNYDLLRNRARV